MDAALNIVMVLGTLLSGIASLGAIYVAYRIHKREKLLTQRQLLLPLWEYMSTLTQIDPDNPITPDIIKVANTLELIAVCCEGQMIDPTVIKRVFGDVFMALYQTIEQCPNIPGIEVTGKALLMRNPAAMSFYAELLKEHQERGKLSVS